MPAGPATLRLMACLEAFSHEEDGVLGRDDWPALAGLLRRELEVVSALIRAADQDAAAPELAPRAAAVRRRLETLDTRLTEAGDRARAELAGLDATTRRLRSVRGAYARPPARREDGDRLALA